jgi:hypothetical protein
VGRPMMRVWMRRVLNQGTHDECVQVRDRQCWCSTDTLVEMVIAQERPVPRLILKIGF